MNGAEAPRPLPVDERAATRVMAHLTGRIAALREDPDVCPRFDGLFASIFMITVAPDRFIDDARGRS